MLLEDKINAIAEHVSQVLIVLSKRKERRNDSERTD